MVFRESLAATESSAIAGGQSPVQAWQEAAERDVTVGLVALGELLGDAVEHSFTLPANKISEEIAAANGRAAQTILRTQEAVTGHVRLTGERLKEGVYRIALVVANDTELDNPGDATRERAVMRSLLSAHSILNSVDSGEFVSLLETPEEFCEFRAGCKNVGTWPVLVGEEGSGTRCCLRPSFCTTIRRSRRRAREICLTEPRSTKSCRCGF